MASYPETAEPGLFKMGVDLSQITVGFSIMLAGAALEEFANKNEDLPRLAVAADILSGGCFKVGEYILDKLADRTQPAPLDKLSKTE